MNRIISWTVLIVLAAAGFAGVLAEEGGKEPSPVPVQAVPSSTSNRVHSILKRARAAMMNDQHFGALREYEMAVERTEGGKANEARAEALFGAGMLRLSQDAVTPDEDRGVALLKEFLATFPGHNYSAGPLVALELLAAAKEARLDAQRAKDALSAAQAAHQEDHEALTGMVHSAQSEAATRTEESKRQAEKIDQLQNDLARQANELASLRAVLEQKDKELKKKDDALRRMKKALTEPRTPINPSANP